MKKNYTQPNFFIEKLDSFDVIVTSTTPGTMDPNNPYASGNTEENPILAPKRQGIWDRD